MPPTLQWIAFGGILTILAGIDTFWVVRMALARLRRPDLHLAQLQKRLQKLQDRAPMEIGEEDSDDLHAPASDST